MFASGNVRRRRRVGCRIVLWSLAAVVVLVGLMRMASRVFRVAVAERCLTVTARKVPINKARTVILLAVVAAGLRWLAEELGRTLIQTQIPTVVAVTPVRLVRVPAVVADGTVRVLVVVVVTVGMAAAVAAACGTAALVVAAVLATSHLMLYRVRLLERPVTVTVQSLFRMAPHNSMSPADRRLCKLVSLALSP
jgi:hypothetical protein